ncbi:MAG: phosphoribosylglycinamide formyltransferase [Bacteroidetes bacterium]|uniref:Phosphoribosylglycinamide formyltransferase n=1 Tax=Candidatus Merdivivens pullicola TaxID=2840872 RepID=A0A9D9NH61_9BACT|nr:phosphoribosylglycinamide formyltransferase [Candidatus Merdivivens pullicola]
MKHRIAVFASGSGTNFEAIARACADGALNASVELLVCDNPSAAVIDRARRFGIRTFVFMPKSYPSKAAFEYEIAALLDSLGVEMIALAGYMRIVGDTLMAAYGGRILNIHPALLPAFKGAHAIRDSFEFGVKVFGVTVHYIDETIDGGTIVAQRAFEYYGRDIEEVERRIHEIEHVLYVEALDSELKKLENI